LRQVLLSGITAGLFSAVISALVSYKVALKQIQGNYTTAMQQLKGNHENSMNQLEANYKNTMDQLKQERQGEVIKDKLNVYSFFLYQLKKVMSSQDFQTGNKEETIQELMKAFDEIDFMLKNKFYLLTSQAISEWMQIRGNVSNLYLTNNLGNRLAELRSMLIKEYNTQILLQYKKISGDYGIDEIPPD